MLLGGLSGPQYLGYSNLQIIKLKSSRSLAEFVRTRRKTSIVFGVYILDISDGSFAVYLALISRVSSQKKSRWRERLLVSPPHGHTRSLGDVSQNRRTLEREFLGNISVRRHLSRLCCLYGKQSGVRLFRKMAAKKELAFKASETSLPQWQDHIVFLKSVFRSTSVLSGMLFHRFPILYLHKVFWAV